MTKILLKNINKANCKGNFTFEQKKQIQIIAMQLAKDELWKRNEFHNIDVSKIIGSTDSADIWVS